MGLRVTEQGVSRVINAIYAVGCVADLASCGGASRWLTFDQAAPAIRRDLLDQVLNLLEVDRVHQVKVESGGDPRVPDPRVGSSP